MAKAIFIGGPLDGKVMTLPYSSPYYKCFDKTGDETIEREYVQRDEVGPDPVQVMVLGGTGLDNSDRAWMMRLLANYRPKSPEEESIEERAVAMIDKLFQQFYAGVISQVKGMPLDVGDLVGELHTLARDIEHHRLIGKF